MPVHDWTLVEDGIFHAFHVAWLPEIQRALNDGLLPKGYYALAEQHFGRPIADVLTLQSGAPSQETLPGRPDSGGTAVADVPPRTRRKQSVVPAALSRRRTLAIRHVSGHRLIAVLEVVSPANKDREIHVTEFAEKAVTALEYGVHLLMVDLFPPGPWSPQGMHGAILELLEDDSKGYDLPKDEPLTLASYIADHPVDIYLEHLAVGAPLPEMPLFLSPDRYINVPLESTYRSAYSGMPAFWRNVLEGRPQ